MGNKRLKWVVAYREAFGQTLLTFGKNELHECGFEVVCTGISKNIGQQFLAFIGSHPDLNTPQRFEWIIFQFGEWIIENRLQDKVVCISQPGKIPYFVAA